ncbi:hypothetical protein GQ44DRAFT_771292 [Phaeosphaeriaceae sp. PMI808]|nr:hypothetical protein GQ44DRAFT_771292 [Phaeosphaeriaceae sp. PMI808]
MAKSVVNLQSRIEKVEELLGIESKVADGEMEKSMSPPMLGIVVVKGNRSIYYGQNDRNTLLNQFLDVKDFINSMSHDDCIQAAAKQVKFLQNKCIIKTVSPISVNEPGFTTLLKLQELLPPKPYCDRLVAKYFNFFERTLRVLHVPTFMRHYDQLWTTRNPEAAYNLASILPQLTTIMIISCQIDHNNHLDEDRASRMYLKGPAIDVVQAWLDGLGRRQRTELCTLQVEILLLLARKFCGIHPEKLWISTGSLVRSAMVMGLNINPSMVTEFSPYQGEMRRRIWVTILEIDLQASMTTGMPVVLPELDSASLALSNLNDLDFNESSASLPLPHSQDIYTDSTYQAILASSLPQRLRALSLLQCSTPDIQAAIQLGRKVDECIRRIPKAVSLHNSDTAPLNAGSLLHRVLLDLHLRRPVLCLYIPLHLGQQQDSPFYAEIQKRCLDYSLTILSYQDLYTITALAKVTDAPIIQQNFFYACCKMDLLWAALTCCQYIKVTRQTLVYMPSMQQTGNNKSSIVIIIKTTIDSLIERIAERGSDMKDIVFLALALQSVQFFDEDSDCSQALQATERSHTLKQVVVKTIAACRKRLLQPLVPEPTHFTYSTNRLQSSPNITMVAATTPPINNAGLMSAPLSDISFPMEPAEQWFENLPELAVEYTNFQADTFDSNGVPSFGITEGWNWEHMWQ